MRALRPTLIVTVGLSRRSKLQTLPARRTIVAHGLAKSLTFLGWGTTFAALQLTPGESGGALSAWAAHIR